MAHTKTSRKRIRQNETHRRRNGSRLSRVRTAVKAARRKIDEGAPDAAEAARLAASELDKAAKANLIHRNAAARRKSRLAKAAKLKLDSAAAPTAE